MKAKGNKKCLLTTSQKQKERIQKHSNNEIKRKQTFGNLQSHYVYAFMILSCKLMY